MKYPRFFYWTGNKVRSANEIVSYFPKGQKRYIEPFLGSGAVFFEAYTQGLLDDCDEIVLSDFDERIINIWISLRDHFDKFLSEIGIHQRNVSKEYFDILKKRTESKDKVIESARIMFLTNLTFSHYLKGPLSSQSYIGDKKNKGYLKKFSYDREKLLFYKKIISDKRIIIKKCDYRRFIGFKKSLIYLDPPYKNFVFYKNKSFDEDAFLETLLKLFLDGNKLFVSNDIPFSGKIDSLSKGSFDERWFLHRPIKRLPVFMNTDEISKLPQGENPQARIDLLSESIRF